MAKLYEFLDLTKEQLFRLENLDNDIISCLTDGMNKNMFIRLLKEVDIINTSPKLMFLFNWDCVFKIDNTGNGFNISEIPLDVAIRLVSEQIDDPFEFKEAIGFFYKRFRDSLVFRLYQLSMAEVVLCRMTNKRQMKTNANHCTYIFHDEANKIYKIGMTTDLDTRTSQLKTANPNIILVLKINGNLEKKLHGKYDKKRVDREWFYLTKEDINDIYVEYKDLIEYYKEK